MWMSSVEGTWKDERMGSRKAGMDGMITIMRHRRKYGVRPLGGDDAPLTISHSTVKPPKDESVKTLYICRLSFTSVLEQDIRELFSTYGEIESIRMVDKHLGCAFVTYTTRKAAEKAIQELTTWIEIKGHMLKLLWAYTYKPEPISNQQGTSVDQEPPTDPQRIGAVTSTSTSTQEVGGSRSGENHVSHLESSFQNLFQT